MCLYGEIWLFGIYNAAVTLIILVIGNAWRRRGAGERRWSSVEANEEGRTRRWNVTLVAAAVLGVSLSVTILKTN